MASTSRAETLATRLVEPNNPRSGNHQDDGEYDDEEALFAELEDEIENDANALIREHALTALRIEMERVKELQQNEHGRYTEIIDEKAVIRVSAHEPRCVVHFYHSNFKRCEIMDKHLAKLAPKFFNTRFFRVFVENVPWLVEKLGIKVLPCVICFVDGVEKDRLVGFEELGNNDTFNTAVLELRLANSGVIQKNTNRLGPLFSVSRADDDEIFDL